MTRDETINILMSIQAAYPSFKVPDKTVAVNTWYSLLRDYEYSQVSAALKKYIQTNKSSFAPSIGQIIDEISDIYSENDENEMEAWDWFKKQLEILHIMQTRSSQSFQRSCRKQSHIQDSSRNGL